MKSIKLGLITKIAILVGIVEFMAFNIISLLYAEKYALHITQDHENKLHLINKMLADEEIPISSISRTQFMANILGSNYLRGVVIGANNIIIVSNEAEYLGKKIDSLKSFDSSWLFNEASEKYIRNKNELISISNLKGESSINPLYKIIITIDVSGLVKERDKIINFGILIALLFSILSTITIILFARFMIGSRINNSLAVLKEVENGNFKAQIPITTFDELSFLQNGINSMIYKVGNLLTKYKKSIEDVKVAQEETVKQKDALKKFNERFELTLEAVNDGIWDWNLTTQKVYFSKKWKSMLGYEENDIDDNPESFFNLLYEDDKNKVDLSLRKHFQDPVNNPYYLEVRLLCKNGSYKWILARGKAFFDNNNIPVRMLGYHSDITKEKENAEYLEKQNKIMEEQSRLAAMGEMIGNIAHQWRQPLSTISTAASGIRVENDLGILDKEKLKYYLDGIVRNTNYLSETINTFRNYIKDDKQLDNVIIQDRLNIVLQITEASLKTNDIQIKTDIEKNPIKLNIVAQELDQVIINIINNAKDALVEKEINNPSISLELKKENNKAIISIEDNAGGIDDNILSQIFEPYFTTKHKSVGTGLGLHICYKIVKESFNGDIYVKNTTVGAKFTIEIPLGE